jgi:hypothetical protein
MRSFSGSSARATGLVMSAAENKTTPAARLKAMAANAAVRRFLRIFYLSPSRAAIRIRAAFADFRGCKGPCQPA